MEEKLKAEYEAIKNTVDQTPVEFVLNHLIVAGNENPELEAKIMEDGKTLKDCCKYIYDAVKASVKNKTGTTCVCKTPEEVYSLAEEYYFKEPDPEPEETVEPEKEAESVPKNDPRPVTKPLEKEPPTTPLAEENVEEVTQKPVRPVNPTKADSEFVQMSLF